MFDRLKKLIDNSYSPYSGYRVASIIITNDGKEYEGVNVESASFGATVCAERNAIQSAITDGMKIGELKEVHLLAFNTKTNKQKSTTPCGICRQVIAESSFGKANIYIYDFDSGKIEKHNISSLLPGAFTKEDLIV